MANGLITPTFKLKRNALKQRVQPLLTFVPLLVGEWPYVTGQYETVLNKLYESRDELKQEKHKVATASVEKAKLWSAQLDVPPFQTKTVPITNYILCAWLALLVSPSKDHLFVFGGTNKTSRTSLASEAKIILSHTENVGSEQANTDWDRDCKHWEAKLYARGNIVIKERAHSLHTNTSGYKQQYACLIVGGVIKTAGLEKKSWPAMMEMMAGCPVIRAWMFPIEPTAKAANADAVSVLNAKNSISIQLGKAITSGGFPFFVYNTWKSLGKRWSLWLSSLQVLSASLCPTGKMIGE